MWKFGLLTVLAMTWIVKPMDGLPSVRVTKSPELKKTGVTTVTILRQGFLCANGI